MSEPTITVGYIDSSGKVKSIDVCIRVEISSDNVRITFPLQIDGALYLIAIGQAPSFNVSIQPFPDDNMN